MTLGGTFNLRRDDLPGPCAPQRDRDGETERQTRGPTRLRLTKVNADDSDESEPRYGVTMPARPDSPSPRLCSRQRRLALKPTSTWQHHEMQWVSGRKQVTPTAPHSLDGLLVQPIRKLARAVMKLRCSLSANGFVGRESGQNEGRTAERKRSRRRCVSHCRNLWSNHKLCVREYYLCLLETKRKIRFPLSRNDIYQKASFGNEIADTSSTNVLQ